MRNLFQSLGALRAWAPLVLLFGAASAQADWPIVPKHQDPAVRSVQDHIDRLCEAHDARIAKINDAETLAREVSQARARFLALLGLDSSACTGMTPSRGRAAVDTLA
jgi:hypothetical protein